MLCIGHSTYDDKVWGVSSFVFFVLRSLIMTETLTTTSTTEMQIPITNSVWCFSMIVLFVMLTFSSKSPGTVNNSVNKIPTYLERSWYKTFYIDICLNSCILIFYAMCTKNSAQRTEQSNKNSQMLLTGIYIKNVSIIFFD